MGCTAPPKILDTTLSQAGIMSREGHERGAGAVLEVRFADGVWYRGKLVERVAGTEPPRW